MWTYFFAFMAATGWIAFFIAEAAYHDLHLERNKFRGRARAAETQLLWHGKGTR